MKRVLKQGSILGSIVILLWFGLLIATPEILKKRKHTFTPPAGSAGLKVPLDLPLARYSSSNQWVPKKTKVSLGEIIQGKDALFLVNFWATWCPPCLDEIPSLEYLNRLLVKAGTKRPTVLLTVSVDEKSKEIDQLYKTLHFRPSFTVLHDDKSLLASSFGTTKFPETYLINSEGQILHKWVGPQNWLSETVLREIKKHG